MGSPCLFTRQQVLKMGYFYWLRVKSLNCFKLRLKALISEVTVEQQILVLAVCYVSVALIRKIAKRTRISTFD